jgi:hypothetical protein
LGIGRGCDQSAPVPEAHPVARAAAAASVAAARSMGRNVVVLRVVAMRCAFFLSQFPPPSNQ